MITKIEVTNVAGTVLTLLLDDYTNGFVLEDVQGLDPVKATIVTSKFAKKAGSQFQNSQRENRNLIVKIGLEPDYVLTSVRSLRWFLYDYFTPDAVVSLRLYDDDDLVVDISGHVESCDAPLFSKEPQMDVSIICTDPDFIVLDPVVEDGFTVSDTTEFFINYPGTAKTGFEFVLHVDRTLTDFTIYQTEPGGATKQFDFSASLVADDELTISTVEGNKFVNLLRGGVTSSVLYGVPSTSSWLELKRGFNNFRVYALGAPIPFTITYTPRHGGL